MKLTAPTKLVFWIATILVLLGLLAFFITIPFVSDYKYWFEVGAFILLWLGVALTGF